MRTLLVTLLALFLLAPVADYADAGKRLGGGSSLGKSFQTKKKVAPSGSASQNQGASQNQAAGQPTNAAKTAPVQEKKRSGFGGLMAGLLGAGILGALFFGGAFEGLEIMDILMFVGLAFVAWKVFSMMRRKSSPPPQPAYATAGAGGAFEPQPQPVQAQPESAQPAAKQAFEPMASASSSASFAPAEIELPEWFNKESFLAGARDHFVTLQAAWDKQDWSEIASYTSAELLESLKAERAKLDDTQHTEVVSVMAELVGFIDNDDHVVVSLNFYGWLREDAEETTELNEIWHLTRDMTADNADWKLVGIEQP
ncbi:MAG: TIM44-like domain-containing protein [Marinobacterium sp.]|nr:TIM44-like domain-containing protein [Marinobacterium sp.]